MPLATCTTESHDAFRGSPAFYAGLLGYQFFGDPHECLALANCPHCQSTVALATPILEEEEAKAQTERERAIETYWDQMDRFDGRERPDLDELEVEEVCI